MRYVKVYHDWLQAMEPLSEGERGRLITAVLQYASGEQPMALTGGERYIFPMFRAQIDRDAESYSETASKRSEAGKRGGRPTKANESNCFSGFSEKAKESKKSQDKDKDEDEDYVGVSPGTSSPSIRKKRGTTGSISRARAGAPPRIRDSSTSRRTVRVDAPVRGSSEGDGDGNAGGTSAIVGLPLAYNGAWKHDPKARRAVAQRILDAVGTIPPSDAPVVDMLCDAMALGMPPDRVRDALMGCDDGWHVQGWLHSALVADGMEEEG